MGETFVDGAPDENAPFQAEAHVDQIAVPMDGIFCKAILAPSPLGVLSLVGPVYDSEASISAGCATGRLNMRTIAGALGALLLIIAASGLAVGQTKAPGGPTPSPEGAKVYFVDLKDGATIGAQTTLHFGLHGMGVAPAGSDKANSGHHHLLIDADLPPLDEPIPSDPNHMHFGAGQTEVDLTLTPGPHTLQLLLGDKNHIPHSPPVMSDLIHVTVSDASAAPVVAAAPAAPDAGGRHTSPPNAKAYFLFPADGAVVPLSLKVRFGLDNMSVVRAGVDAPNSGHHHLIIDAPLPPFDEPIPNDENHLHFGAGQTEANITLTPGKHTLQLLLGDANHVPHIPPVFSAPITVVAGDAPQQKACPPDQAIGAGGACAPRAPPQASNGPPRHRETLRWPRHALPMRAPMHHWAPRRNFAPSPGGEPQGQPQSQQQFNDLRPCSPGTHSQSAPTSTGYRCVLNQ